MKVTFVSNYINHHQVPFCEAMYRRLGGDYHFIQTQPMEEERIRMGWGENLDELPYLLLYYEKEEECRRLIAESDVVLFGGVEDESFIAGRLQAGGLTVRLSERIYKDGQWKAVSPRGLLKKYQDHTRYRKKNVYLLCCGGYVASDFHIVRAYPEKMFKWGYFPKLVEYDIEELLKKKRMRREAEGKVSLLWAGRFIDWKHPEHAIEAAARLKQEGYHFSLTMVGGGELAERLKAMAKEKELEEEIVFAGFQKPEEVRRYMEQADIFLFTSDYREGWGAVLNEAMNSGC
ncbi:MAG: glycosyltransferase family 4 protein, partial [Lachnospiraceae bacterium]|nr:glycosyltransferase family 4 protein [Lachnospiraceae bacterium]